MDSKLKKLARQAIVELKQENEELRQQLEHQKIATSLTFKLYEMGGVQAEDLESKLAEFSEKTADELQVIEKAAELSLGGGFRNSLSLGELSDRPQDNGTLDPLTSFLLEDYH